MSQSDMDELINFDERTDGQGWLQLIVIVLIAIVVGFIAWDYGPWADSSAGDSDIGMLSSESPRRDGDAPDFALLDESGNRVALSDFEGRPIFLNFWATWCTFCKEEMPDMQKVHEQYGDELVVIGVNAGDSVADGEDFVRKSGVDYLRLYDRDLDVTEGYLVQAMPTSYFITANGKISDANFGFMVYDQMIEKVDAAIAA